MNKPDIDFEGRRLFGRSLSFGALTLLTGCDISDHDSVQRALRALSRWNDRVQAALFRGCTLSPSNFLNVTEPVRG